MEGEMGEKGRTLKTGANLFFSLAISIEAEGNDELIER